MSVQEGAPQEAPAQEAQDYVPSKWKRYTIAVYVIVLLFMVHLYFETLQQSHCDSLTGDLGGGNWRQASTELIALGVEALPYVSRAFYYDLNVRARRRAGETLLASFRELLKTAPQPQPGALKEWDAWRKAERLAPGLGRVQLVARARTCDDAKIRAMADDVNEWLEWQLGLRSACQSDMISKGLADEDPECRLIAAKLVRIMGFEGQIERTRYARWRDMERLIGELRKSSLDKEAVQRVLGQWEIGDIVGEFGNSALVGLMATAKREKLREAAAGMLRHMLASAYRADSREEMVRLVGRRRLNTLLDLLASDQAGPLQIKEILTFSDKIAPEDQPRFYFINRIQKRLAQARKEGGKAFAAALDRCQDIYGEVEEGRKLKGADRRFLEG